MKKLQLLNPINESTIYNRNSASATLFRIETEINVNSKYHMNTQQSGHKIQPDKIDRKSLKLINVPMVRKYPGSSNNTPGTTQRYFVYFNEKRTLTTKQMTDISNKLFLSNQKAVPSPGLPPRQNSQVCFHHKSKTLTHSASSRMVDGNKAPIIKIATPKNQVMRIIPANTLNEKQIPKDLQVSFIKNPSAPGSAGLIPKSYSRVPSAAPRPSTFATLEIERQLNLNEKQKKDFDNIQGMKALKAKRELKVETSVTQRGNSMGKTMTSMNFNNIAQTPITRNNSKGKLKPLDKLQHFVGASPVVNKGSHKFFK